MAGILITYNNKKSGIFSNNEQYAICMPYVYILESIHYHSVQTA